MKAKYYIGIITVLLLACSTAKGQRGDSRDFGNDDARIVVNNYYDEYDYYYQGGFSFTIEAGVKAKLFQRFGIYLSADYSVWTISGDHYKWTYTYLSAPGGSVKETTTHYTLPTMAYNQMLLFRVGIAF